MKPIEVLQEVALDETPSIGDLKSQKQSTKSKATKVEHQRLTFEDIHKMHYSLLNEHDEVRPSDLIDFESGDSDHEILAQFKPIKQIITLQQPDLKKYKAPYEANTTGIDEQTGYSNSPKFSVYRLNNN